MPKEITCLLWSSEASGRAIEGVGGPGWTADVKTVVGQIKDGRRYQVRLGAAFVNVVLTDDRSCPLRTDPGETLENELLTLPTCLLDLKHSRGNH